MRKSLIAAGAVVVALTSTLATAAAAAPGAGGPSNAKNPLTGIQHLVVIYEENHSFDNLYGLWPGVDGVSTPASATPNQTQVTQDGTPYACLPQNDPHLTTPPLTATCPAGSTSPTSAFTNQIFPIDRYVPLDQKTEDLVHRYYQQQYQIDGGRMDRFTTGSDAVGLTQGYYNTLDLPIYQYLTSAGAPASVVADRFFHAAFGGSFLNHQWLVAAQTPVFTDAAPAGSAHDLHSVVDANGMPVSYPQYVSPAGSTVKDRQLTAACGASTTPSTVTCGDYAVNTIQPYSQPYAPGTDAWKRLPPLTSSNIGDELSAAGVSWAWYAGGWDNAAGITTGSGWTNGSTGDSCTDPNHNPKDTYPYCADNLFQYHHQPFNYYADYTEGAPGRSHLQDEADFLAAATAGSLPAVSFVKPLGEENEHPGYADVYSGEHHLVDLVKAVESGPDAASTAIVVTYDEHGGFWDHVAPPTAPGVSDQWGPGERVPSLVISPLLAKTGVTHTAFDTTSILATIEHRWHVPALSSRDASVNDFTPLFAPLKKQTG